jgi:hypothetical protein
MQTFEDILILLKTGNKTEAIERYANRMGINEIDARVVIETLLRNTSGKMAVKGKPKDESNYSHRYGK